MGKENPISLSMNLLGVASLNRLSLHVLVERTESGHFMASVPELPDCVALAETREAAIASVSTYAKIFMSAANGVKQSQTFTIASQALRSIRCGHCIFNFA